MAHSVDAKALERMVQVPAVVREAAQLVDDARVYVERLRAAFELLVAPEREDERRVAGHD